MVKYPKMFIVLLTISGCANYSHEKITTTTYPDGKVVIQSCLTSINSMREVRAGDLRISKDCALKGGADSLGANDKMIELTSQIIKRIP